MSKKKNALPIATTSPVAYKPSKADVERENRYRAEDALRCLTRADEIRSDKGLMGSVKALAQEQMRTAKKFAK